MVLLTVRWIRNALDFTNTLSMSLSFYFNLHLTKRVLRCEIVALAPQSRGIMRRCISRISMTEPICFKNTFAKNLGTRPNRLVSWLTFVSSWLYVLTFNTCRVHRIVVGLGYRLPSPLEARHFSLLDSAQTGTGAPLSSCIEVTELHRPMVPKNERCGKTKE